MQDDLCAIAQPRSATGGTAYQILVGSGGSPFDAAASDATKNPAIELEYSWVTVRAHSDGGVDILSYGFDEHFCPPQALEQINVP